MASNILSRLLPPGEPSVYEALHQRDDGSEASEAGAEPAPLSLDEENLRHQSFELNSALAHAIDGDAGPEQHPLGLDDARGKSTWLRERTDGPEGDEVDDDVPMSLLIEDNNAAPPDFARQTQSQSVTPPSPITQPLAKDRETQRQPRQTSSRRAPHTILPIFRNQAPPRMLPVVDRRERALWKWANVQNLDNFLREVYDYFLGNGIWSILLGRTLNLLTSAFVVGFSVFLSSCINYRELPHRQKLADILVPKCTQNLSGFWNFLIWLCTFLWMAKLVQYTIDIRRLKDMHDFYHYLLEIPDTDIQTVSWQDVVKRLMALRDLNPATANKTSEQHRQFLGTQGKQRMDAHDIANRLMRRDNYLIALINKDILDITLPLPFLGPRTLFSKTLEWNISLCVLDYVFSEDGQVRPLFLKDSHRQALSEGLRRRFIFAGVMNIICAPFIIVYLIVLYFLRYFNEYHKNPAAISSRQYTPLADWKFREFNELWHLFERRINMSYPFASRYINQFPKDKTVQVARFIAFVAGALAAVLALVSLIDPDLFLGFEITPERTVLFYLGIFGAVWAFASGIVPEENLVFDPEFALTAVVGYTHYMPTHWQGRLHSDEVRREFASLYPMKVVIFLEEVLSIVTTPFLLWFALPRCSDRVVDFFREFTVHVDGLGLVCSFAVFDFEKGGNNTHRQKQGPPGNADDQDLRDDYYSTKDGKMLASYYNFMDNYVNNPKQSAAIMPHPHERMPSSVFPGMMTSQAGTDLLGYSHRAEPRERINSRGIDRHSQGPLSLTQRNPRLSTAMPQLSPLTSILLDPQHQAVHSRDKPSRRSGHASRLRRPLRLETDLVEDVEDDHAQISRTTTRGDSSSPVDDEHALGDSWKMTRAGAVEDDEDGTTRASAGDKGPGVLGLVYQFSKAQTEGRAGGVQI